MPRQANGTYIQPADTAAVSATTISSTAYNTLETDIGTEITNSLDRLGRSSMQAALPMGGQKITGMADPAAPTDGATKNYVDTTTASYFSTGDMKPTIKTTADSGWIILDDGTIGSAASGASTRANADCQSLYTLLWNNISDAYAPVTTGRGASASADWASNKPIGILKVLGRALGGIGQAAGQPSTRLMGQTTGSEVITLAQTTLPNVTIPVSTSGTISVGSTDSNVVKGSIVSPQSGTGATFLALAVGATSSNIASSGANSMTGSTSSINGGVAQTGVFVTQPSVFLNWMMKL